MRDAVKVGHYTVQYVVLEATEGVAYITAFSGSLRTLKPHSGIHEIVTSRQLIPVELVTCGVDSGTAAVVVPEATGDRLRTAGRHVSVGRREHVAVVLTERVVADAAREPGDRQLIVVGLVGNDERAVLGPEPRTGALLLHVEPQLAAAIFAQRVNLLVAQPEVAARITESISKLVPRSIEETRVVNTLLNQYRFLSAEVCKK